MPSPMPVEPPITRTRLPFIKLLMSDLPYLKGKALAAQTPKITVARGGGLDAGQELVSRMETAVRVHSAECLVPGNGDAGAGGFARVQRRSVSAINFYG